MDKPIIVGVEGSSGAGKSSLVFLLEKEIISRSQYQCLGISLDCFLLPIYKRLAVSKEVHYLCRYKGGPGTYAHESMNQWLHDFSAQKYHDYQIPNYCLIEDRVKGVHKIKQTDILFCDSLLLGAIKYDSDTIKATVNKLDYLDPAKIWVNWQQQHLIKFVEPLQKTFDLKIYIDTLNFNTMCENRMEQWQTLKHQHINQHDPEKMKALYQWAKLEPYVHQRLIQSVNKYAADRFDIHILNENNRQYRLVYN